ncbi:MAG: helix-turn-helix domain-containing protein [Actinomycetota bacterium]|nr:helix-turn-helix domain-containing protein [Actinomycetota bacterium]
MKSDDGKGVADLEAEIGRHLRARRIDRGLRQIELADLANISVATLSNLETGKGGNLSTLIKVLRALDAANWIHQLAPAPDFSPLALLDRNAREGRRSTAAVQRVRTRRTAGT